MPSRNNPNVPTSQKRKSSRSKVQKRNAASATASSLPKGGPPYKKKNPRGTAPSSVLHPSSGPAAPLSGKKARKVERAVLRERRRRAEAAGRALGEVVMADAPRTTKPKSTTAKTSGADEAAVPETMDVDVDIS